VRFRGRALVVDDDAAVATAAARLLAALGLECDVASGGLDALDRFSTAPEAWTLVVCDVLMPGLNGPDTVSRMRSLRDDLPVLFMSGYAPLPDALSGGPRTAFVDKPFDASSLAQAVGRLVPEAAEPAAR
jgi:CheY-like chemotaxis protein